MDTPGLVKREILPSDIEGHVVIRETWDLKVPGCPVIAFKPYSWPLQLDHTVSMVVRTVTAHAAIAERLRFFFLVLTAAVAV